MRKKYEKEHRGSTKHSRYFGYKSGTFASQLLLQMLILLTEIPVGPEQPLEQFGTGFGANL